MNTRSLLAPLLCALSACTQNDSVDAGRPYDATFVPVSAGHVPLGHVDVLTQHNDLARTGQNLNEIVLNQGTVTGATFGKLATLPVDSFVFAQPLVITSTKVKTSSGEALHDVLLVATMHNTLYAFDAATYKTLWTRNLGPAIPASVIATSLGGWLNGGAEVGVLATPVVDRVHGYIYVTRADYSDTKQVYVLHVLDLSTGSDVPGSPATIKAHVEASDGGMVSFDPAFHLQRTGLLLLDGTVYMAFTSHQDYQPYHGWIMGYTYSESAKTLTQTAAWNDTPDGGQGGIWSSGQGLLSDGTSIYAVTSNGSVTAPMGGTSYGESFVKLTPTLDVLDWFTPIEWEMLNEQDMDLGSAGPLLIPGTIPLLMVGGGKEGKMYVVDSTKMGHLGTTDDRNTQEWFLTSPTGKTAMFGAPVLWTGSPTPSLFTWAVGDVVRKFVLTDGLFGESPAATSGVSIAIRAGDPAGALALSSNGSTPQTGILWGVQPASDPSIESVAGTLYAFSADDLTELWDSNQNAARDGAESFGKFVPPTVANGKVYLATQSHDVLVYGILPAQ